MAENETEVLAVMLKKQMAQKMTGLLNLGQKRRRSVTPIRPVAIAPKTNFPKVLQNVEICHQNVALINEPGFITIVPRTSQIHSNRAGNKSVQKVEQYEILDSLNSGLNNPKRIKLSDDDASPAVSYIILQNQSLDNCNAIRITNDCDTRSNQSKKSVQDHTIKKKCISNSGTVQQYNVLDKLNSANFNTYSVLSKTNSSSYNEQVTTISKSDKLNALPTVQKFNLTNESELSISKNTTINILQSYEPLNSVAQNFHSFEISNSAKSKSQKPVVIMQQLLSPPNKMGFGKTERFSIQGSNKLIPLNIQGSGIELKQTPPPKSNNTYYGSKTMSRNVTKGNNDEQDNEFLLKKEFPVISSSQVDSVLKAIDMQSLNKGILSNEGKKRTVDLPLPSTQSTANFGKNHTTQCVNTVTDSSTKLETNRPAKQLQIDNSPANYSETVQQLVDTLQCYKCKECSYMSLNEKHIFDHVEREHINSPETKGKLILKCMGCSNTFHFQASLLSHIVHDHEVHESEAQIMVQQLSLPQNLSTDDNCLKSISQIRIPKTQNEQIFASQPLDPLLLNTERTHSLSNNSPPSKIMAIDDAETVSLLETKNNPNVEVSGLQYLQNIHNISTTGENNLEVDVRTVPFFNNEENEAFLRQSHIQEHQQEKLFEIKNVNSSENLNLIELKTASERSFEFVNFDKGTNNGGEGSYLQEEDTTENTISESEMEFGSLAATELNPEIVSSDARTVKIKKKGRPKRSKTHSAKMQSAVSLRKGYQCEMEDCGVRMLVQENIIYHQKCHVVTTAQKNPSFQCPECIDFKTNNWNNLAGHLWRSHIIDMELHSCDLCSYKTPSLSNLTNQHRGIHGVDRPFLCDNCGKGFKTRKQLRNHRDLHKAKAKEPLKCDECGRDFTNTRLLKLHKDIVHKESKPFACNACPYSASTRSALKLHLRRHTGEKPFVCDQCSYSTGDHNSLRRHKQRHLGLKPYSCPHCSYACIQSSTYKVHLKNKHPGQDHNLMFSCQYCTYKSLKKENLLTHMAKHEQVSNRYPAGSGPQIIVD